jgi:hypothetical protein
VDQRVFAVNGTARGRGFAAIEPIWQTQPLLDPVPVVARRRADVRRGIFVAIVKCEDEAAKQAEKLSDDLSKQIDQERKLSETCKTQLRTNNQLTEEELSQIGNEGVAQACPPLKPGRVNIGPIIQAGLKLCQ